jgi:16S rRNA processing protein RimM
VASDDLVVIGEATRAYGLRGELRVVPQTDHPERFGRIRECILWDPRDGGRTVRRVRGVRRQGDVVLLSLEGCDTPEAAAALAGRLVALPRTEALPPPPGHVYPWQLVGCRVTTEDGRLVGDLSGVEPAPGQALWVVQGPEREHLIPAVPEIVIEVDVGARRVVIRPPEGLLEL